MSDDRFGIVGKVIARTYEIRDVVAEGGFGVVYRAYHRGFRAEVALKCLKIPDELSEGQRKAFLEQFRGEAEVLFRLSAHNSNIVRPLHVDAFQTKHAPLVPFMALEWLDGRTLDALITQRRDRGRPPISLEKLVRLLTPVAHALEQAHNLPGANGIQIVVHRDMKPENLFIARIGEQDIVKVLDFGISKVKSTAGQMVGRASQKHDALVSFSPAYGAPEQWAPRRFGQTGRWTDVWGLALTVVEAAKGDEVVQGDQAAMMGTILDPERRPTPRNEGVTVSDAVELVFSRALALDPRSRYQTIGEYWDDLTEALGLKREIGVVSTSRGGASIGAVKASIDSLMPPPDRAKPEQFTPPRPQLKRELNSPPSRTVDRRRDQDPAQIHSSFSSSSSQVAAQATRPTQGEMPVALSRPRPVPAQPTIYSSYPRPSIWKALSPSLALIALSIAVTVLDRAIAHTRGVPLTIGPVHASWVAGGCMVAAIATAVSVLRRAMDD